MRRSFVLFSCLAVTTVCALALLGSRSRLLYAAQSIAQRPPGTLVQVSLTQPNAFDCTAVSELPLAECAALVMLYESTAGPNWLNNSQWLANNRPCTWYGVGCQAGHVRVLALPRNHLVGTLPATLGELVQLEKLSLQENQLQGLIPPAWGSLINLREVTLSFNQLTGVLPAEIGNWVNLQLLYLHANQFQGALPATIGNLTKLEKLYLRSNQLSGSIPGEIGNLTNLKELSLSANALVGALPNQLGKLVQLELLYLQANRLSGDIPIELGALVNLQKLYLSENQLTGQIPSVLGNLVKLQELSLSANQLSGSIPAELGQLIHLQRLYLQSNYLRGVIPPSFSNLSALEKLYLSFNQLDGQIPPQLGTLPKLQEIFLAHNQLHGELPATFGNLTNVITLTVSANVLTGILPATLTALQKIQSFRFRDTELCQPQNEQFQAWLAAIPDVAASDHSCAPEQGDAYEDDNNCPLANLLLSDGVVQTHTFHQGGDTDWLHFQAKANVPYRVTVSIPITAPTDVVLDTHNHCAGAAVESFNKTFTPGVFTTITRTVDGPVYLHLSNVVSTVAGIDVAYQISVRPLDQRQNQHALVLVAGGLATPDRLQNNIDQVVTTVYNLYRSKGYSDDDIYFLTSNLRLVGRDANATLDNLAFAITDWARQRLANQQSLTLYLMDHGDPDTFYLDKSQQQIVTPEQLDGWLDQLEAALPNLNITVIIEACYSGSFIEGEKSISKGEAGRLVIASTSSQTVAYASAAGAYFSDFFLFALQQEYSLYDSFRIAYGVTGELLGREPQERRQIPQLDADGNGIANEPGDITLSTEHKAGYIEQGQTPNLEPYVEQVQSPSAITNQQGRIQAIVQDDQAVKRVWAVIQAPSYHRPTNSAELVPEALPSLSLLEQNKTTTPAGFVGTFAADYSSFTEIGVYQIMVYAEDQQGLVSKPKLLAVRTGTQLFLPLVRHD